jgi:hypothetical protein
MTITPSTRQAPVAKHYPGKAVVERVCDENLQQGARCIRPIYGHGARACLRKILQHKFFNRRKRTKLSA